MFCMKMYHFLLLFLFVKSTSVQPLFNDSLSPFFMPTHLYLIFSVDMGHYSRPLHMHTHVAPHTHMHSGLAWAPWQPVNAQGSQRERDTDPKRGRWDMQMQTCFPTGAQCQLSLHPAARSLGPIRVRGCTPKSSGIGLPLLTPSLVLTLWRNNKGDWWEVNRHRNVSISE